jgi:hypothetical protein
MTSKRWVYIICEVVNPYGGESHINGQPASIEAGGQSSFRHTFVQAETADEAYTAGHRELRQPRGNGINDYVVELPS